MIFFCLERLGDFFGGTIGGILDKYFGILGITNGVLG